MAISLGQTPAEPLTIEYQHWEAPGFPVSISIHRAVMDGIARAALDGFKSLPRRGVEIGGVLLGKLVAGDAPSVFIEQFEPVPCEYQFGPSYTLSVRDKVAFAETAARGAAESGLFVVGYYRSHTRHDFQLEPSDLEIINSWYKDQSDVFLIVKPLDTDHVEGEFFFWENGKLRMESRGRRLPFTKVDPPFPERRAEPRPPVIALKEPPPPEPEPVPVPMPVVVPPEPPIAIAEATGEGLPSEETIQTVRRDFEPQRSFDWRRWGISLLMGALLAGGLLLLWWQFRERTDRTPPPAPVTTISSLGLNVQVLPKEWRVLWNRDLPVVQNAARGTLFVTDGAKQDQMTLDQNQLRTGGIVYEPEAKDVTFRLELVGPQNQISSESFRIMRETKPAPAPAPAPATQQPALPITPPKAIRRVPPVIPAGIRPRITKNIPVDVRVHIDRSGRVISAAPVVRGRGLTSYLASKAVAAARKWRFEPAHQGDITVPSTQVIHFVFEK
jgi:TonB family protein